MESAQVLEPIEPPVPPDADAFPLSTAARGLLAVLSIGAATIHLVMVPAHAGEWLPEGLAFALSGWFALAFAVAVVAKPSKRWLEIGLAANLVFIAAWAVTRFVGMPFGPESGTKEVAGLVDLTCVGLEAALVLACAVLMNKPRLGEHLETGALVMASIIPLGVIVLTTAVVASPNARNHAHADGAGHADLTAAGGGDHAMDHGAAPMDHGATGHAAAGDHSMDHAATGATDDHAHPATPVAAERCDWEFNTVAYWSQDPPQVDDGSHAHSHGSPNESANPPAEGATVGNKAGLQVWTPMTDKAKCAKMKSDLAVMESMATKYPTAQSALDAGCVQVTVYVPGIARHIACFKYWMQDDLDVNTPEMLLYGGNQPWAPLVGLSYYTYANPPDPTWVDGKMPWHIHQGLCVKGTLVIGGDGSDAASCEARGGKVMGKTGNMGHYWVPSCSSPDGVFSADNPRLDIGVSKFNDDPKFDPSKGGDPSSLYKNPCQGSKMQDNSTFGQPPAGTTESASGPTK
jgi:hypothetical protein